MNEYPNSIRNNMVNTTPFRENDYNIQISNLPDPNCSYKPQRGVNLKTIVIAVAIAAATLGGVAYNSYVQHQSMLENTAVVSTLEVPGDATLNITKNPEYSYFVMPDGTQVGTYNGMSASEMAKNQVEISQNMGRQM